MKCQCIFRGKCLLCVVCILMSVLGYESEYESTGVHFNDLAKCDKIWELKFLVEEWACINTFIKSSSSQQNCQLSH